ncbi:MAG: GNAT family N-acetyltransferase [Chloroflexia bacterium]|nr:GNAT family N-acetyltransferase [Chloroflexia bacterium]
MSATTITIRAATPADIDGVVAVHRDAFNDKFLAAFGRAKFQIGVELMAETWRRQGPAGLQGMWVAIIDDQIVATIALRARVTMRQLPPVPVEWLFIKALGFARAMYALTALSAIDHPIAPNELYISDVAVRSSYQRRGVARALLHHATSEARRLNLKSLCLFVSATNRAALALYQQAGYTVDFTHYSLLAWVMMRRWQWLLLRAKTQ